MKEKEEMIKSISKVFIIVMIIYCIGSLIKACTDNSRSRDSVATRGMEVPLPSIEYVQETLNKVIDPALFPTLEIDGVAGSKTIEAWQFYSTGWNAYNERKFTE